MSNTYAVSIAIKNNEGIKNIKDNIINALGFDADWSGDNGESYLKEKAIQQGFESNNEWFVETHFKSIEIDDIAEFFNEYFSANSYYNHDISIIKNDDYTFIALALTDNN